MSIFFSLRFGAQENVPFCKMLSEHYCDIALIFIRISPEQEYYIQFEREMKMTALTARANSL